MEGFINSLQIRLSEGQNIALPRIALQPYAHKVIQGLYQQGFCIATIDIANMNNKKDLALSIIKEFLEKNNRFPNKICLKIDLKQDDNILLNFALDLPDNLAQFKQRPTVVLFTQFHEVQRIGGKDLFKLMRSHLQMHKNVTYLFCGSEEGINKIFGNRNEVFFRFCHYNVWP